MIHIHLHPCLAILGFFSRLQDGLYKASKLESQTLESTGILLFVGDKSLMDVFSWQRFGAFPEGPFALVGGLLPAFGRSIRARLRTALLRLLFDSTGVSGGYHVFELVPLRMDSCHFRPMKPNDAAQHNPNNTTEM